MKDILELPVIARAATLMADSINVEARTVDIVWTTGAIVQRVRWEGWEDRVEYDEELVVDATSIRLERMNAGAPFLDSHSAYRLENVLGSVVEGSARIEGGKGYATIKLTSAADAADIVQRILEKSVRFVSVGYRVHKYEITKQEGVRELWRAVDWEPMEVSAVAIPADAGSHIRSEKNGSNTGLNTCVFVRHADPAARSAPKEAPMPDDIKASGEDEIRSATPAVAAAPVLATPAAAPDAAAIRAEAGAGAATILDLCHRHGFDNAFSADLIRRGVTVDAARVAILDQLATRDNAGGRTTEPTFAQARGEDANEVAYRDGVANALMHRHSPGAHQLTEQGRQFRGMSLLEMGRESLERRGISTRGMSKMELATEALRTRAGQGYHSTSDFPSLLANVANKTLRSAYESTPRTFMAWARQATATDFKPVQRTQIAGAPDLIRVPESGEFSYGTIGEGKEVYALTTYGRIIAITRQTLINDDLDAFTRVPTAFGASAADLESDLVYAILTSNPVMSDSLALFVAGHGNVGTAAAITEASLAEAYRAFGNQRGIEGRQVSVQPRFLITPPGARSVEARKNVTATTPSAVAGVNAFAGRLEPIEEPRLIPASGADPWFLAADPSRVDTVEYAYLEGSNGIFTETRQGFEVDGIEIKARHDFAAKAIDWRGLFRNLGV